MLVIEQKKSDNFAWTRSRCTTVFENERLLNKTNGNGGDTAAVEAACMYDRKITLCTTLTDQACALILDLESSDDIRKLCFSLRKKCGIIHN